jgi:hypothetical protein
MEKKLEEEVKKLLHVLNEEKKRADKAVRELAQVVLERDELLKKVNKSVS